MNNVDVPPFYDIIKWFNFLTLLVSLKVNLSQRTLRLATVSCSIQFLR